MLFRSGLDDIVTPGVTEAKVIFGQATGGNVDATLVGTAGNTQGFSIAGLNGTTDEVIYTRVAGIGDFNGDGLGDMIVTAYEVSVTGYATTRVGHIWVVYGKTDTSTVDVRNLQPSEGFWIKPYFTDTFITGIDSAEIGRAHV